MAPLTFLDVLQELLMKILENRDNISFWSTGYVCLLSSITNIISSSRGKVKQFCLVPIEKDLGSLSLGHPTFCICRHCLSFFVLLYGN